MSPLAPCRRTTIDAGIPVVYLDRAVLGIDVDTVTVDNVGGARECVRHLITMGHRDIAVVTGSMALMTASDRLKGYKLALREAGIAEVPEYIRAAEFRREAAFRACQELMLGARRRPTAVFACNNTILIGVLEALAKLGIRCPEDVAVAAFDDPGVPEVFRPSITAVMQPAYEIGRRGAEILMQRIRGEAGGRPVRVELRTELTIRESSLYAQRTASLAPAEDAYLARS